MKVVVDRRICTGHARCQDICPDVFGSDEIGYAVVLQPEVPASLQEDAARAAANCPEGAIRVEE
ncbi:MAG TPA: ferredoxin [Nevskiaceae bacterium]|nr:ferredoxin [Nevskiaceae bacterium]